jgi:hypothetical protein
MTYNYFLSVTTTPAIRFRVACQSASGLYNVYAVLSESDEPVETPELCQPNEAMVFENLRTLLQVEQCIRVAGSDVPDWDEFLQFISLNRSHGRYHTGLRELPAIASRAVMLLQASVRDRPLERFGMVACERKDIAFVNITQESASMFIWIGLHSNPGEKFLAASFSLAEKDLAVERLEQFRRRANRQTLDPTIDFVDPEPLPIHQRAGPKEADRMNTENQLLELDRYKNQHVQFVEVDEDADIDDKVAPNTTAPDFTGEKPAIYTVKNDCI